MGARWATTTAIHMQASHLLTLSQWLSPAYPVGAFAWSHGLERAISAGLVSKDTQLADWLGDVLTSGAGRTDAILLHHAHTGDDLVDLADLAAALAPSRERRAETLQQGAAFAATTRAVWGLDLPDMAFPVAVGRAAGLMGIDAVPVAQVWLQAFVSNLIQAATRLMPLGQTAAQKMLHDLSSLCEEIGEDTASADLDDMGSATFAVDIASMQHGKQYTRIFRS